MRRILFGWAAWCLACSGEPGDSGGASAGAAGRPSITPQGGSAGQASGGTPSSSSGGSAPGAGTAGVAVAGTGGGAVQPEPEPDPTPTDIECEPWPEASADEPVEETIEVEGVFDGEMKRFFGVGSLGSDSQDEGQPAFFSLADGAVLKNVVLGKPAADGIHCRGSCTLQNVWFEDVGEDAATLDGESSSQVMTVQCAGARHAADKVFQHNGPGTVILRDVWAEDFGKLYRSCGNCDEQYERHAVLERVVAEDGTVLAGVNQNYGDSATFSDVSVGGGIEICWRYEGNDSGAEPDFVDGGADGEHCVYQESDIHEL